MEIYIVATDEQLNDAFKVRHTVFVEEQGVPPEIEIDELENKATHFVGYENDKPIAAGRIRFVDDYGKLERVCVLKEFRGNSYGKQIISRMEQTIANHNKKKAKLNAQTHAESFYRSLGYKTISDQFMDAGIPHVTMIKEVNN